MPQERPQSIDSKISMIPNSHMRAAVDFLICAGLSWDERTTNLECYPKVVLEFPKQDAGDKSAVQIIFTNYADLLGVQIIKIEDNKVTQANNPNKALKLIGNRMPVRIDDAYPSVLILTPRNGCGNQSLKIDFKDKSFSLVDNSQAKEQAA